MRHNAAIVWHRNVRTRNVLRVIFFNFSEPERLSTYQNEQTEKPDRLPIVYKLKLCFQEKLILSAVLVLITPGLQVRPRCRFSDIDKQIQEKRIHEESNLWDLLTEHTAWF